MMRSLIATAICIREQTSESEFIQMTTASANIIALPSITTLDNCGMVAYPSAKNREIGKWNGDLIPNGNVLNLIG